MQSQMEIPILTTQQVHENRVLLSEVMTKHNPPKLSMAHFDMLPGVLEQINAKIATLKQNQTNTTTNTDNTNTASSTSSSSSSITADLHYLTNLSRTLSYILSRIHPVKPKVNEEDMNELVDYMHAMPNTINQLTKPEGQTPLALMKMNMKTTRKNRHLYCQFCRANANGKPEPMRYTVS
jgi:small-conductance mechanosensitive channel